MLIADLDRSTKKKSLLTAFAISLILLVCGASIGYASISPAWAAESLRIGGGDFKVFGAVLPAILLRNLGVVMFLYSGVATFGLTSIISTGMLSVYIGATMAVGASNVGAGSLVGATGLYVPFEFTGCLVAATAGLYPTVAALSRIFTGSGRASSPGVYIGAFRTSLVVLAWAGALILLAAIIETVVIAAR